MCRTIKIICRSYRPNTAWMNRLVAYAKAFTKLGHNVVFVFVISDTNHSIPDLRIQGVTCINLWLDDGVMAQKCKYLSYLKNINKIKHCISDGDICMLTDASGFFLRQVKASNKSIKIFFESTEHPEVLNRVFNKHIELKIFYRKLRQVDRIFVITHNLKELYKKNGIPDEKISVVNMYICAQKQ